MKALLYLTLLSLNCFCSLNAQSNNELSKPERLYLHTDRNVYLAGENLFYKLYIQGNNQLLSKYAYLDLRNSHNTLINNLCIEISNQTAYGHIYLPDTLQSDIYQLVCYTNWMRNEGEDSYFTKEIVIANRFDKKLQLFDSISNTNQPVNFYKPQNENLNIYVDKQTFGSREKVTFTIETKDNTGDSVLNLSVSVGEIVPGISDGPVIKEYFNSAIKTANQTGQNQFKYQPELKETSILGKILPVKQNMELNKKSYTILVSTPDTIANMQYTKTDSLGTFRLPLNQYYNGKELIISLKENIDAIIEMDNKFKLNKPFVPSGLMGKEIKSYLIRSFNIAEAKSYYTEKPEIIIDKEFEPVKTVPRLYYKPNFKIIPADYQPLNDFVEITQELLPTLKVRKNNDSYTLSCFDPRNQLLLNMNPIIFLDGVPVNDVNQIISLGSEQIKSIEILPIIRYYGEMSLSGILSVYTKNMEINNIKFKTPTLKFQALSGQSYTKPKNYTPANIKKQIPDLRQLLFWDPQIIMHYNEKLQLEFYTSDLRGNYQISIQGITSNGVPVSGSATIQVKSNLN